MNIPWTVKEGRSGKFYVMAGENNPIADCFHDRALAEVIVADHNKTYAAALCGVADHLVASALVQFEQGEGGYPERDDAKDFLQEMVFEGDWRDELFGHACIEIDRIYNEREGSIQRQGHTPCSCMLQARKENEMARSSLQNEVRSDFESLRASGKGICQAIREVAVRHLDATTVDIIVALGMVNQSTIRIQVAKVRDRFGNLKTIDSPRPAVGQKHPTIQQQPRGEHRAMADAEIARCRTIAAEKWGVSPNPSVVWKLRGTTGGRAHGSHLIDLNEMLAMQEGEKYRQTVGHEYAHCVVAELMSARNITSTHRLRFLLNGKVQRVREKTEWAPHGSKWQAVMRSFGLRPDRCHQYDVSAVRQHRTSTKTIKARCDCREHMLTPRRAAQVSLLRCKTCKGRLMLV